MACHYPDLDAHMLEMPLVVGRAYVSRGTFYAWRCCGVRIVSVNETMGALTVTDGAWVWAIPISEFRLHHRLAAQP